MREVHEETGLIVRIRRWAGQVTRPAPSGSPYLIDDYVCDLVGGDLRAGDDARAATWASRADCAELPLAPDLFATLADWRLLPD